MRREQLIGALVAAALVLVCAAAWMLYAQQQERTRQEIVAAGIATANARKKAEARTLTPQEDLLVATFNVDVASVILDGSRYRELLDSTDAVIALARKKPEATYSTKQGDRTMRQVIGDAAGELGRYQPEQSRKLELALETLPPQ